MQGATLLSIDPFLLYRRLAFDLALNAATLPHDAGRFT